MLGESSALLISSPTNPPLPQQVQSASDHEHHGSATVVETIINEAKTCMGTGCLALPYAARVGGVILHVSGLFAIGLWNIYSVHRLCQCLQLLPNNHAIEVENEEDNREINVGIGKAKPRAESITSQEEASQTVLEMPVSHAHEPPLHVHHRSSPHSGSDLQSLSQQRYDESTAKSRIKTTGHEQNDNNHHPPPGTSTYSRVAFYAFGPLGLLALDVMMAILFIGVVVAFVDATREFLRDTSVTSGSDIMDAIGIACIIGPLSAVPDIGYLSRASAIGLAVLFVSFAVIAFYGWLEYETAEESLHNNKNTFSDNDDTLTTSWHWLPENGLEGVSHWFGCVVFGYGIAPLTYNFRESMTEPQHMVQASTAALLIVAGSYVVLGVGLYSLFPDIDGDVLHTLPSDGWLPVVIRLSMAVVVFVTAPLLILPCGQLIEGKITKDMDASDVSYSVRIIVRMGIALTCVTISVMVPGFVSVLSLVGCASVAAVGFVVPPLLYLRLRFLRSLWTWDLIFDAIMLVWGVVATGITTSYTFQSLLAGT